MAERKRCGPTTLVWLCLALLACVIVLGVFHFGAHSFMYEHAQSPRMLSDFLDSPAANARGVKVNGHLLEIGKRPSLQVVRGYGRVMYQLRPYRQVNFKYRSFTKAEVMDFCSTITGEGFLGLRSSLEAGSGFTPAWKGKIGGRDVMVVKATHFSYLVTGLADKPLFLGQVELAKRLGMSDETVLSLIVPPQDRWLEILRSSQAMNASYPVQIAYGEGDALIAWLVQGREQQSRLQNVEDRGIQ